VAAAKDGVRTDCAGGSGDFLPPSPPDEKANARQDQAGQSGTGDGAGDELASNFTTGDLLGVNVEVGHLVL
jgi:hypothetical protein